MSQSFKRQKFSGRDFQNFITEINTTVPDMTKLSWKNLVRERFLLDDEEEKSIDDCPKELSDEVQDDFLRITNHVQKGGTVEGKIILNSNGTHSILIFLEQKSFISVRVPIACCDANCRNWRWGRKNCS